MSGKLPALLAVLACVGLLATARVTAGEAPHHHDVMEPGAPIPGESLYQLNAVLTGQNGKQTQLAALRGKPALLTMFYASCQGICPVLATTLQRMEAELTAAQRARLQIVMVSFDPKRDTVEKLRAFGIAHQIDEARWLLARTPEPSVRELAAALGIRYRPLPDGTFSHSASILLLDRQGVVRARTDSLTELDAEFMRALRSALEAE